MEEILKIVAVLVAATIGFTISGVAGFGGGLVALPVLVWVFGIKEAIPIIAISQVFGTSSRACLHHRTIDWKVVRYFAVGSIPMSVLGSLVFISINTEVIVRILGITMLTLVVYTRLPIGRNFKINIQAFVPIGGTAGFGSAFLGIPGPMASLFYLQYGLIASAYIGTSAIGLGMIQIPKLIIFGSDGLLTTRVFVLGVVLGLIGIFGAYMGKSILKRVPEKVFSRMITVMLLISGFMFLVRA
jgi:uncharacterized membrane protein YfcA